ncbi:myb/SANT-like DNA-binding domain-containing protein 4 [Pomacea canaliculata]|uniref:myb/SANT-like DNA-binding domain-containing protein 4 n=1 Tax=Pomacea canaliculata TaxID=400727 RepID=UPI000D73FC4B|nr:myb/SANT-like DNA-binding domain-containing protein 4 [Pomacea canaliculata]
MAAARKARKANFSNCEDVAIIESYRKQKHVLQSKFKSTVTNRKKQTAWTEVTNAVNSVSAVCRTTKEVKERWVKLTKKAKAQLRARKYPPTSSGKNDEMANLDVMADILLGESDLTDGIAEGGIDAGDTQPKSEIDTPTDTVLEIIADDDGTMHLAPYSTTDCLAMSVTGIPHRSAFLKDWTEVTRSLFNCIAPIWMLIAKDTSRSLVKQLKLF